MYQPCYIFDLDGTICNIDHRLHHIKKDPQDWDAFFAACVDDEPLPYVLHLHQVLTKSNTGKIILCTGRMDKYRKETEDWLRRYAVTHDRLLMRRTNDFREDWLVKREMLEEIRNQGLRPIFAVEDRPQVVKMWRENDVPCLQTDAGEWIHRRA